MENTKNTKLVMPKGSQVIGMHFGPKKTGERVTVSQQVADAALAAHEETQPEALDSVS